LVGEQKLNDFLIEEAKIGEKQSRRSNSKFNFMRCHYVFFEEGIHNVYIIGFGVKPKKLETSRIFVVKVTLQSVRLL